MSEADGVPEYLKCVVCRETLSDPITLQCGHTFCTACVTSSPGEEEHDTSVSDGQTITCPLCGTESKLPEDEHSENGLAKSVNTAYFIKGLLDTLTPHNEDADKFTCTVCGVDDDSKRATRWCAACGHTMCQDCLRVHDKLQPTHETADVSIEPVKSGTPRPITCGKHGNSPLDLYCEDCEKIVCQRCCILNHKSCKSVLPIDEANVKLCPLLEQHSQDLEKEIPELELKVEEERTRAENLEDNLKATEQAIDGAVDQIVEELHDQQRELKDKVQEARDTDLNYLLNDVKDKEMRLADKRQRFELARAALKSENPMDHYEMYKIMVAARDVKDLSKNKPPTDSSDLQGMTFVDNKDVVISQIQRRRIGYMTVEESRRETKENLKVDTEGNYLYDMTVVTHQAGKHIVVTLPYGKLVYAFQRTSDEPISSIVRLGSQPYGVTQLEPGIAAVALPKKKQILLVRVHPQLETDSVIRTQLRYIGITGLTASTMAASGEDAAFIDIIDRTGTRLRSFGADTFLKPLFLATSLDNHILVSDWKSRKVVCVSGEGEVIFRYDPEDVAMLAAPCGVAQSVRGDIYIVDRIRHAVIQLDQTGQYVRDRLTFSDDISDPNCVCVDSDNTLYVSVDNRYVHIYDMNTGRDDMTSRSSARVSPPIIRSGTVIISPTM